MRLSRWIAPLLLAVALFTIAWPARGDAEPKVVDEAHFFKPETIASADDLVKQLKADTGVEIVVETFDGIPEKAQARWEAAKDDPQKRKEFFDQWIEARGHALKLLGVYVLIVKDPPHLAVEAGKVTRQKAMPRADQDKMASVLLDEFKQKNYDQGLQKALDYARDTIKQNLNGQKLDGSQGIGSNVGQGVGPEPGGSNNGIDSSSVPMNSPGLGSSGPHFFGACMWFVIIAIGVIFIFNLVRRGLGGGGGFGGGGWGANQNYGPPGSPGYGYGPPRGGFMSGLFGGLLGGAAGSYLENRLDNQGQGGGSTGQGNFGSSGGENSSGGSSQGDFGPPDAGPSGGDFGSSGGDFGGGGGDSGGGGSSGGDF